MARRISRAMELSPGNSHDERPLDGRPKVESNTREVWVSRPPHVPVKSVRANIGLFLALGVVALVGSVFLLFRGARTLLGFDVEPPGGQFEAFFVPGVVGLLFIGSGSFLAAALWRVASPAAVPLSMVLGSIVLATGLLSLAWAGYTSAFQLFVVGLGLLMLVMLAPRPARRWCDARTYAPARH